MGDKCVWSVDEDGNWNTSCDNIAVLIEGTPLDNDWVFCPYCGKIIQEVSQD